MNNHCKDVLMPAKDKLQINILFPNNSEIHVHCYFIINRLLSNYTTAYEIHVNCYFKINRLLSIYKTACFYLQICYITNIPQFKQSIPHVSDIFIIVNTLLTRTRRFDYLHTLNHIFFKKKIEVGNKFLGCQL